MVLTACSAFRFYPVKKVGFASITYFSTYNFCIEGVLGMAKGVIFFLVHIFYKWRVKKYIGPAEIV